MANSARLFPWDGFTRRPGAGRGGLYEAVVPVLYVAFEGLKSQLTERLSQVFDVLHNDAIAARLQLGKALAHPILLLLA